MRAREFIKEGPNRGYNTRVICEGGNAFPDVGTIHKDEIEPTLKAFANMMKMPELANQALGSVGKSEYSGDIDIAIDVDKETMKELSHDLRNKLGNQRVTGVAGNIAISFPIENYDKTKDGRQPRTGKVQIDLIPGEPGWMQTFFHSPGDDSVVKGVHRNFLITIIALMTDRTESSGQDDFGRPLESVHWVWGPKNGLIKVKKTGRRNARTSKFVKAQDKELLSKPTHSPDAIAKVLFGDKASGEALHSVETLIDATKKSRPKKEAEEIFKRYADHLKDKFVDAKTGFTFPEEIQKYL